MIRIKLTSIFPEYHKFGRVEQNELEWKIREQLTPCGKALQQWKEKNIWNDVLLGTRHFQPTFH